MIREYYDPSNGHQVSDPTDTLDLAQIQAQFPFMTNATQRVDILPNEAVELVGGNLQKYDLTARKAAAATARENSRQGRVTAILAKMNAGRTGPNLTEQDLFELGLSKDI